MQITAIVQQKRNLENVNLFLDGKFWVSISKNQLVDFGIFKNLEVVQELHEQILQASLENKYRQKVLNYLSFRPRTEFEIRVYLTHRLNVESAETILNIIEDLKSKNLINDLEFGKWFVEAKLQSRKIFGKNKIKVELAKKGLSGSVSKEVLESIPEFLIEKNNENFDRTIEKWKEVISRKYDDPRIIKQKLLQKLMARGVEYDKAKKMLN